MSTNTSKTMTEKQRYHKKTNKESAQRKGNRIMKKIKKGNKNGL